MGCNCYRTTVVVPPTKDPCTDCLVTQSYLIKCGDGPNPCGGTGSVDISENNDYSACSGGIGYSIVEHSPELGGVSIAPDGLITFTTLITTPSNPEYFITYRAKCDSSILSATGTVNICTTNLCQGVVCPDGQECESCTGNCVDTVSDLGLQNGNTGVNQGFPTGSDLTIGGPDGSDLSILPS